MNQGKICGFIESDGPLTAEGREWLFFVAWEMIRKDRRQRVFKAVDDSIIVVHTDYEKIAVDDFMGYRFRAVVVAAQVTMVEYVVDAESRSGNIFYQRLSEEDRLVIQQCN